MRQRESNYCIAKRHHRAVPQSHSTAGCGTAIDNNGHAYRGTGRRSSPYADARSYNETYARTGTNANAHTIGKAGANGSPYTTDRAGANGNPYTTSPAGSCR